MANRTLTTLTAILQMNNTKFKSGLSGSQKALGGFKKSIMNIGGTIAAAFSVRAIINFTKRAVEALDTQLKAEKKVSQAIISTGMAAGYTAGKLNDMARGLQKITLFGDEEILGGVTAQLLTFTNIAGREFERTQQAVLDVATVLGQDLKTTAIQLGKALNDPVANLGALGRSGIQFTKDQKKLIKSLWEVGDAAAAQGLILEELERQYGGQAEAAALVDIKLTQVKNSLSDLSEAFADWLTEGKGGFFTRGMIAGIEDLQKLFQPRIDPQATAALESFMASIKDEAPARQAELLASEIERQHKAVQGMAKQRKALTREEEEYTGKFQRQKRVDVKQQIDLIDQQQDQLIATRHLFEDQLKAVKNIKEVDDTVVETLEQRFQKWVKINDEIRKRIKLQEDLDDALNDTKFAIENELKELVDSNRPEVKEGSMWGNLFNDEETFGTEGWEPFADQMAKMEKAKAMAKEFGILMSQTLVSQMDTLGESIGKFAAGAEDAFRGLGDAIMQNLGNILIMMGAQSGNIPLLLAGMALQLGGGILRGLGSKSDAASRPGISGGGRVDFRIQGKDLYGVLDRYSYSRDMNT